MKGLRGRSRRGALMAVGLVLAALPAHALAPGDLSELKKLERGRWQIVNFDRDKQQQSICLGDSVQLVQLEHRGLGCEREVIEAQAGVVTVQYSCRGRGFGHTSVRVETPRLARIATQGVSNGRPFSWHGEARRTGGC